MSKHCVRNVACLYLQQLIQGGHVAAADEGLRRCLGESLHLTVLHQQLAHPAGRRILVLTLLIESNSVALYDLENMIDPAEMSPTILAKCALM